MQIIVRSSKRHHVKEGWLETWFHFSFDQYYDASNMGWGALRVFNDDFISPGGKFGMHLHANYEIFTVMLEGALEHMDSTGEKGTLLANGVQAMSAGLGVYHSEANAGKTTTHSYQIWIEPEKKGGKPEWHSHPFKPAEFKNALCPLVSGLASVQAPLYMRQKAAVYRSKLEGGKSITHSFPGHFGYLFVISGELKVGRDSPAESLFPGDALKLKDEKKVILEAGKEKAEFLLFDLP